jgi:hypothetical protein
MRPLRLISMSALGSKLPNSALQQNGLSDPVQLISSVSGYVLRQHPIAKRVPSASGAGPIADGGSISTLSPRERPVII